jgi:uncharacterized protein DUF397
MEKLVWRKATRSSANGGDCVEIARTRSARIAARDSKNPTGPQLRLTRPAFARLLDDIKAGRHNL